MTDEHLQEMLARWNDQPSARTISDAEKLIVELQITLGGKDEVIKVLRGDIEYLRTRPHPGDPPPEEELDFIA